MLKKRNEISQGAVEFALVVPLLLLILWGIIEGGRMIFIYVSVLNASREAARYGAATGIVVGQTYHQYEDCAGIKTKAKSLGFLANIQDSNISITYDQGPTSPATGQCQSGVIPASGDIRLGSRIRVRVQVSYAPMVPLIPFTFPNITSTNSRTILTDININGTAAPPPTLVSYTEPPAIISITPNSGSLAGGTTVVIAGTFLTGGSVKFGANSATCTVNNDNQITCTTPAALVPGDVIVVVTNTNGSSSGVPNIYTYMVPPAITGINPATGPSSGGTNVTITGTNLTGGTVTIGGNACTVVGTPTDTQIVCLSPISLVAGAVPLVVTAPGGTASSTFSYIAVPTLASLNPASGLTTGGASLVLNGAFLTGGSVNIGGFVAGCVVNSAAKITCTTPTHAAGPVSVFVTSGLGTSNSLTYTYVPPPPTITSFIPANGLTVGGTSVVITGTYLTGATVNFGVVPASCVVNSDTQVTCTAPPQGPGAVNIIATTLGGTVTSSGTFTYINPPAPTISTISPNSGLTTGGLSVTISGTNLYMTGGSVTFGGTSTACTDIPAATTLTCTTPAHTLGAVPVVVNTLGGSATKNPGFTYIPPVPTVTSISPSFGPLAGGNVVIISGTGLYLSGGSVVFDTTSASCSDIPAGTQLICFAPAHAVGLVTVHVTTTGGSATGSYNYSSMTITGISPIFGSLAGGTSVTITGTNLSGASSVIFDAAGTPAACSVTSNSANQIICTTSAHVVGLVDVTVTSATAGTATASRAFTYTAISISSISPVFGSTLTATNVNITGNNLDTLPHQVTFGGILASACFFTPTLINCDTPEPFPHTPGPVDVVIGVGADTATTTFTYIPPNPSISLISPNSGPMAGGTTVTITGANLFLPGGTVTFGGTLASCSTLTPDSQISCITPAHAAGTVTVTVNTQGGSGSSAFTYLANPPTISSMIPSTGPTTGNTLVTFTGTNLLSMTSVTFGGVLGIGCTAPDDTHITCNTPSTTTAGTVPVVVTTAGNQTVSPATGFAYTYPVPTISSLSPSGGPVAGGTTVTINGTGFLTGTTVNFGTNAATGCLVISSTQMSCTSPKSTTGASTVLVTATNLGGTSNNNITFAYSYPVPVISAITPTNGPPNTQTAVTITGSGFTGATTVTFGGTSATGITVVSDITITCTTPSKPAGAVTVAVTTPGGTGNGSFTYNPAPVITSISPTNGTKKGGTTPITITGTNLTGGTVTFGGTAATCQGPNTATQMICTSPAHSAGAVAVIVNTSSGGDSNSVTYTYTNP